MADKPDPGSLLVNTSTHDGSCVTVNSQWFRKEEQPDSTVKSNGNWKQPDKIVESNSNWEELYEIPESNSTWEQSSGAVGELGPDPTCPYCLNQAKGYHKIKFDDEDDSDSDDEEDIELPKSSEGVFKKQDLSEDLEFEEHLRQQMAEKLTLKQQALGEGEEARLEYDEENYLAPREPNYCKILVMKMEDTDTETDEEMVIDEGMEGDEEDDYEIPMGTGLPSEFKKLSEETKNQEPPQVMEDDYVKLEKPDQKDDDNKETLKECDSVSMDEKCSEEQGDNENNSSPGLEVISVDEKGEAFGMEEEVFEKYGECEKLLLRMMGYYPVKKEKSDKKAKEGDQSQEIAHWKLLEEEWELLEAEQEAEEKAKLTKLQDVETELESAAEDETELPQEKEYYKGEKSSGSFKSLKNPESHNHTPVVSNPYSCDVCQKHFTRSSDLERHVCTHTEQYPFKCETCGKGFSLSKNLAKHNCNQGNDEVLVSPGENNLETQKCSEAEKELFVCCACGEKFPTAAKLQNHSHLHFCCRCCSKQFLDFEIYIRHINRCCEKKKTDN